MSNFFERIMCFAENQGFKNPNDFARNGLNWSSSEKINRLKGGDKMPSVDILLEITEKFPQLNPSWLLTGEGEMLKDEKNIQQANNNSSSNITQTQGSNALASPTDKNNEQIIGLLQKELEMKNKIIAKLMGLEEK